MAECCDPGYEDGFVFPRRPANRPALPHIGYRIGAYPDFVEAMLRHIDASTPLSGWTHRAADDPGIALLEGAAIVGDILTFYQEHYANEAFLRTARWRDSVGELVRLLGYRLAPGLGGRATFAFKVKGSKPVEIPAGFPLKAELRDLPDPADFQTGAALTAYPWLSNFNLYRPRKTASGLDAGSTRVELAAVGGRRSLEARSGATLKKGDRLLLLPAEPAWTRSGSALTPQAQTAQVVKIANVSNLLDRMILELETAIAQDWSGPVTAYRIGRSFRHFGHNAPPKHTRHLTDASGKITGASESATSFERHVYPHDCTYSSAGFGLPADFVPLDQEVDDLAVNGRLIVQCQVREKNRTPRIALTVLRRIRALSASSMGFGNLNGASSFLWFDAPLVRHAGLDEPLSDVREWRLHEVTSAALSLRGETGFDDGAISGGNRALCFFGTREQVEPLEGRRLLLEHEDGRQLELRCTAFAAASGGALPGLSVSSGLLASAATTLASAATSIAAKPVAVAASSIQGTALSASANLGAASSALSQISAVAANLQAVSAVSSAVSVFDPAAASEPRLWALSFDTVPKGFRREDFDEAAPRVRVSGNLVDATQGKAERPVVLGNGDARARFQTFKLPKAPLTYLLSDAATPPQVPELDVHVEGRAWTRVASLFGRGPMEEIYIVREDAEGNSWVQFGDGQTGARLPSGVGNVGAGYRSGNGAHGPARPGTRPSAGQKIEGLEEVRLPGVVGGGAQPEDAEKAREAAPGKVQSLGRLVSLQDYETEAKSIPGVVTAAASWGLKDGVPAVLMQVLLEAGREAEFAQVRATLAHFQRCRGPDAFPVAVEQAFLRYAYADVLYSADARLRREDVEAALRASLGLVDDPATTRSGLFGLRARTLGAGEYASRVEGVLQQVAGIAWCRLGGFGMFASGKTDPTQLALPAAPRPRHARLGIARHELLQLHPRHLTLAAAAAPTAECA